jgi:hypothetical protein
MNSYFCDGLKEVTILNGVARLEFHRLQPANPGGSDSEVQSVSELVVALPLQGVLQTLSILEQVRARLVQDERARRPEAEGAAQSARSRSPNFT